MRVYLDNAATTPLDPEVLEAMTPYMLEHYGNPSSTHWHGREVRAGIERSRKKVADLLSASPSEIFFTSGGTEADNTAIRSTIKCHKIKHAITSKIEHHAVLHTLQHLAQHGKIQLSFVNLDDSGFIQMDHLEELLQTNDRSFVSIMHANNEIGNLNDIEGIGELCEQYDAIYHSDTVQTMGHYVHNLTDLKVKCIAAGAHKFHGPKGCGFMYVAKNHKIDPMIFGGGQERNMRAGTENAYGIVGTAKALEIAYRDMEDHRMHIQGLKDRMIAKLREQIEGVHFNGGSSEASKSLYTVLNICLPPSEDNDMLLFHLDINKISASGGSACSSGATVGSHVIAELNRDQTRGALRFSFSKFNTAEEIDYAADKLAEIVTKKVTV